MAWQIRPASTPLQTHPGPMAQALNTRDATRVTSCMKKVPKMSKTPNLRQGPTGPTIYAPMKLPPMVSVPLQPPIAPSRPAPAPLIPADKGSSRMGSVVQPPPGAGHMPTPPAK
jgi:hypothetical protein